MKTLFALLASLALPIIASAQVRIVDAAPTTANQVTLSGTYTQNFDSLVSTTTVGEPWTNNTTLPGWYAYRYGSENISLTGTPSRYYPSTGTNPSALTSYGKSLSATDRALGATVSMGEGSYLHFGMQFSNDSSQLINSLTVTFDGERWYSRGADNLPPDSLVFSYQIFDADLGSLTVSSGWTTVDSLTFYSPFRGDYYSGDLDGNLPENRVADLSAYIADISLEPGQEIWLRWTASDRVDYSDDSLAIDNLRVSFTAVPEPASSAALAALAVTAFAARRRRPRG